MSTVNIAIDAFKKSGQVYEVCNEILINLRYKAIWASFNIFLPVDQIDDTLWAIGWGVQDHFDHAHILTLTKMTLRRMSSESDSITAYTLSFCRLVLLDRFLVVRATNVKRNEKACK